MIAPRTTPRPSSRGLLPVAERMGLQVTGPPNADGWCPCRAVGRTDRDPSARFNIYSGVYIDNGGGGKPLSFAALARLLGASPDEARRAAARVPRPKLKPSRDAPNPRFPGWQRDHRAALTPALLADLSRRVGLPADALDALGVGHEDERARWTFPMMTAAGLVVGLRTRTPGGSKRAVTGSRNALMFSPSWATDPPFGPDLLLVVEGPTDAAAGLAWGFPTIGRSSANVSRYERDELLKLVRRVRPNAVVFLSDRDEAGRTGAAALAAEVNRRAPGRSWVCLPPTGHKDAREWFAGGGTAADVRTVLEDARPKGGA